MDTQIDVHKFCVKEQTVSVDQMLQSIDELLIQQRVNRVNTGLPANNCPSSYITLAFAQTLDGAIAHEDRHPMLISSTESMQLTHFLRSRHSGIMIGSRTALENPNLTTRLVDGPSPRPIVVDSRLELKLDSKILQPNRRCVLLTTPINADDHAKQNRKNALELIGATVLEIPHSSESSVSLCTRVNLRAAFKQLNSVLNIETVMVEGGASIIESLLEEGLYDQLVVTIAPRYVMNGFRLFNSRKKSMPLQNQVVNFENITCTCLGSDIVLRSVQQQPMLN